MDAVIFDVDGTLVDSVDLHAESWQRALRQFGHEFDYGTVRAQIGKGADQLVPDLLGRGEAERIGEALDKFRADLFRREYLPRVRGFPHVRVLFERILADGRRIALASSAKGEELQAYKRAADIADLVDAETSSDDAEKSKPHPDIFAAALDRLQLRPERVVVVGDTPYDAIAAGRAGIAAVGVLCGGFPEADLRQASCREIYRDPQDLLDRYEDSLLARDLGR